MIHGLGLSNVRVFDADMGEWEFPFSRLSVLCGTNSAGKSTILKSLLLLLQSHTAWRSVESIGQLQFNGPLVDLGGFESLVTHRDVNRDVTISLQTFDFIKSKRLTNLRKLRNQAVPAAEEEYTAYSLETSFRFGLVERRTEDSQIERALPFDSALPLSGKWTKEAYLKEASFDFEARDELNLKWTVSLKSQSLKKLETPEYEILIPADYFDIVGGFSMMDVKRIDPKSYVRIECLLQGLLPGFLWAKPLRGKSKEDEHQETSFPIPPLFQDVCNDLNNEFREVHYIGPLRSPAKRFYISTGDKNPLLDAAGEFLPQFLRDKGEIQIKFAPPGLREWDVDATLRQAVNLWLHYLRTGKVVAVSERDASHEIDASSVKDLIVEFTVKSFDDELYSLADSGFGYSQLLPILVRGLLAGADDTVIIEQPEVHLNPALQIRMAEFLYSLAKSRRNVIVETHSEHIVNTLRVLAAEDESDDMHEEYTILYLSTESGAPLLCHLEVQDDGTIPEWPKEFMGETMKLTSRLLKAQDKVITPKSRSNN